jgi:hypothetical protein
MRSTLVACAAPNLRWKFCLPEKSINFPVTASRHRTSGAIPQWPCVDAPMAGIGPACAILTCPFRNLRAQAPAFRHGEEARDRCWDFDLTAQAVIRCIARLQTPMRRRRPARRKVLSNFKARRPAMRRPPIPLCHRQHGEHLDARWSNEDCVRLRRTSTRPARLYLTM